MRDAISHDPYTTIVSLLDEGFMLFYRHVRRNARRITNLVVTLVPLMALLVGSCKTSQTSDNIYGVNIYGVQTGAQQFQAALFPDQASFHGVHYTPAAGYVSQARDFVEAMPQTMMMLTRDDIGYLFGKPSFHRRDADAEVWQYKTGACVVDFYFYGKKQLSYVDARRKDQSPASGHEESKCLHNIDKKDFDSAGV